MKKSLLNILNCPICHHNLSVSTDTTGNKQAEALTCLGCHANYPIRNGIPCLLTHPPSQTQRGFTTQWQLRAKGAFENDTLYGMTPHWRANHLSEHYLSKLEPGDWVIDAGCGSGDVTFAFAKAHPELNVVGFDFNDCLISTHQNLPNLHFVHADVMHLPFKAQCAKVIHSWGMLHHTENSKRAFDSLIKTLAPNGAIALWLYPDKKECDLSVRYGYYFVRDKIFLKRGHLLSDKWRFRLVKYFNLFFLPIMIPLIAIDQHRILTSLSPDDREQLKAGFPFRGLRHLINSLCFIQYDNITPPYQHRHHVSEVLSWFKAQGLSQYGVGGVIKGFYWGHY